MPQIVSTAAVALCISRAAFCQPAAPMPAFEVASVKVNCSSQRGSGIDAEPGKVTIRNVSLKLIIQAAYLTARRMSMEQLAGYLTARMDHPVLDMTGIGGLFDITLDWTRDDGLRAPASEPAEVACPSLFTALQERLGLKLEARKGPVTTLVIDHAEQVPAGN
jgi:hypothetical protein